MISKPRPIAPSFVVLAAVLGIASLLCGTPHTVYATTKNYVGVDNSSWNTAGNWSPGGVPAYNDDAILGATTETASSNLDVIFNGNYSSIELNSLTLNSSGLPDYMILNQTSSSSYMNAGTENIGTTTSENTYNQSAGTNLTYQLNLGVNSQSNFYNLSGTGVLNVTNVVFMGAYIGVSGTGVFNQSGGTATVTAGGQGYVAYLVLGQNAAGNGTYNLSSGTLNADGETIGNAGTGQFNQTGGTNNVGALFVGGGGNGGTGTYNLSGGTLYSYGSVVIQAGGTFNLLSGGTFGSTLDVQGGVFKLAGGSFASSLPVTQEGGAFQLNGYSTTFNGLKSSGGVISDGAAGNSTLTLAVAAYGTPVTTFTQAVGGTLQDGSNGKLSLNFTGAGAASLGGTNSYSGTTTVSAGLVQAGAATGFSSSSAFVVNGGTLDANNFNATLASLAGSGGTVNVGTGSLNAGGDNTSTSFAGSLTGTGTLNKTGTGTLTLSGGGTFGGTINVQSGTLAVGAANGVPTASSVVLNLGTNLSVAASQILGSLADGDFSTVTLTNTPTLTLGGNNTSFSEGTGFNGNGTLVKTGTGTLTLGLWSVG